MSVSLQEVLLGLGEWGVNFKYDAWLLDQLEDHSHLIFSWGERDMYTGVLLTKDPDKDPGIFAGGRALDWWQGMENDGPIIEFREYLSGVNKLSNPGFELEDLYWRSSEGTQWAVEEANPHSGTWSARVTADSDKDDVLQYDQEFATKFGDTWQLSAWVKRLAGTVGKLRLRATFTGLFDPPNLLPNPNFEGVGGWTDVSETAGDTAVITDAGEARSGTKVLRLGTTRLQRVLNTGFEVDLETWDLQTNPWTRDNGVAREGSWSMLLGLFGVPTTVYLQPSSDAVIDNVVFPSKVGERYRWGAYLYTPSAIEGEAYPLIQQYNDTDPMQNDWIEGTRLNAVTAFGQWQQCMMEYDIVEGRTDIAPLLVWENVLSAGWRVDSAELTRLLGNSCKSQGDTFSVTPERQHQLLAAVRSGPNLTSGKIRAQIRLTATGRDEVIVESSEQAATDNEWVLLSFNFEPPSGYATARVTWIGLDIYGDYFYVDDQAVELQSTTEVVYDTVSAATQAAFTQLVLNVATPAGAEKVRLELVAESLAGGWVADDASITRTDQAPKTVATIVNELLVHPDTGDLLTTPGSIVGTDFLEYDWAINNLSNREALRLLSRSGLAVPLREWRWNPDNSVDWDVAEELFADRVTMIFTDNQFHVTTPPSVRQTVETKLTDLKVIGQERTTLSGKNRTIQGSASRPPGDSVDWFGNPLSRKRIVEDSSIDHDAFADAFADYGLEANQEQEASTGVTLANWRAFGDFEVGDWVYLYKPEAGLQDLANQRTLPDGRIVFPVQKRVLVRNMQLGPEHFKIRLRKGDGTEIDVTDFVIWSEATTAELEVGSMYQDFTVDPQGGAAGNQFLRYRAG